MDKDAFIRRYAKACRPLGQYEMDINRHGEQQHDIQGEDHSNTINFIKIDCSLLKSPLVNHCLQRQTKLTRLLNDNAEEDLKRGSTKRFKEESEYLRKKPLNLDELSQSLTRVKGLKEEAPAIKEKFDPLFEKYEVWKKFSDVGALTDHEQEMLDKLRPAYGEFVGMLVEVEKIMEKSKVNMERDHENALESFNNRVKESRKEALSILPYSSDFSPQRAKTLIAEVQAKIETIRTHEEALKPGLGIFKIDLPDPKDVRNTEKELEFLTQIWKLTDVWGILWNHWKGGQFATLKIDEMDAAAGQYGKSLQKLKRDISTWKVWIQLKDKIDQFKLAMPLIQDLGNPAMRPRHWNLLRAEISKDVDPNGKNVTLEAVFSLGSHLHAEFIGEMSSNANKELAIEKGFITIEERRKSIDINLTTYKTTIKKFRNTEDLFQSREDDQVAVSTMKASKFYAAFKESIDKWGGAYFIAQLRG